MRVVLDARMAWHSGIGRYVRGLVRELPRQDPDLELTLLVDPGAPRETWGDLPVALDPYPAEIYSLHEQWLGARLRHRRALSGALFHFPHYNAPWLLPPRSVVTVHDLTHLELSEQFPRTRVRAAELLLRRIARRAARLITVSSATRDALQARFPSAVGKTRVVHLGVDAAFRPPVEDEAEAWRARQELRRFFLFVGSDRPHKNLDTLLRAFAELRERHPEVSLVLVTQRAPGGPPRADGVRELSGLDDAELARWYGAAEALVLPSWNEGFGLPALEALACGTPVIASDIPALREVLGDAGLFADPGDRPAWAEGMGRMLRDAEMRRDLTPRAIRRAAEFSWARAAQETLRVYAAAWGAAS